MSGGVRAAHAAQLAAHVPVGGDEPTREASLRADQPALHTGSDVQPVVGGELCASDRRHVVVTAQPAASHLEILHSARSVLHHSALHPLAALPFRPGLEQAGTPPRTAQPVRGGPF